MKVLIAGAGKMGRFFCDVLSDDNIVGIFDVNEKKLRYTSDAYRFEKIEDIDDFNPDILINAVTVKYTIDAFNTLLPHINSDCLIADIASVKTGLPEFYSSCGHRFVSTHPMFGPTFATLDNLQNENAIIIKESDPQGIKFFKDLYNKLRLNIFEYTFDEHDETIAYSLSIPFASTLVFAGIMKHQEAPGTTYKRHLSIARGLMSEDDYLLSEILFNPHTEAQLSLIQNRLEELKKIVVAKDTESMQKFLNSVRQNLQ